MALRMPLLALQMLLRRQERTGWLPGAGSRAGEESLCDFSPAFLVSRPLPKRIPSEGMPSAQSRLKFGDWPRNVRGFSSVTLSISSATWPRAAISKRAFGTASGSLGPQSPAEFIQIRSEP